MANILFYDGNIPGTPESKTLNSSTSPIYSKEIGGINESAKPYLTVSIDVTGTVSISIGIRYKGSTGIWGSTINIESGIVADIQKFYRLDAELGKNWLNSRARQYVITLNSGTGSAIVQGEEG